MYEFQVANSRFDPLIKMLLRLYGGQLSTDFTTIAESYIAKALNIPTSEVESQLNHLHDLNIVIYDAAGQLLRQFPHKKTNNLALPIDLTLVPSGIYLIKIQSGSQIWSRRLVVSR